MDPQTWGTGGGAWFALALVNVRDRWILALGVALLAAFVVVVTTLFTRDAVLCVVSLGGVIASAIALTWLLHVKKADERSREQVLG
jgi:heme/copper-type cytochrome/quinol oxidase subunit 4